MNSSDYNVLFIMVDDLRPELGCYDNSHVISPNIDRLAKMGQLFEDAYVSMPSCGPSRASLLSGLYPSSNRFLNWNCSQDDDVPGLVGLPKHLRDNGYKTVSLGKVYNNFDDGIGGWDKVWWPPITTTEMWDYQTQEGIEDFKQVNRKREMDTSLKNYQNVPKKGIPYERAQVDDLTYHDGIIASQAIEELQQMKQTKEPFFLAVGFKRPHLPFNAPEKYWELYDKVNIDSIRRSYSTTTLNMPKVANHNSYEIRGRTNMPSNGEIPDSIYNKLLHGYLACVSYVDFQVGRIINSLEYLGIAENTIIVFWGDHGFHLGENGMWGKATNFGVSSRIPLIFKVPNQEGNVKQKGMVESVDIYPTLCDLLGLKKPFHLQGESFAKKIDKPNLPGKNAIFLRMFRSNMNIETVRTNSYSYTEYADKNNNIVDYMLYDLKTDPHENDNIYNMDGSKNIVKDLQRQLDNHLKGRDSIFIGR